MTLDAFSPVTGFSPAEILVVQRGASMRGHIAQEASPMTGSNDMSMQARCACGACVVTVKKRPKVRFVCHCLYCQAFTGQDYSDVTPVRGGGLTLTGASQVRYKTYRRLPPNLARGRCVHCDQPIIESIGAGPFKAFFVPSRTFDCPELLPTPAMHAFYNRRVADVPDTLPKHRGYWSSQLAIIGLLAKA